MTTDVSIDPGTSNVAAPSPELRIFAATLAYQMRPEAHWGRDMSAVVLLSYLEEIVKGGRPVTAEQLADGAELAVRCGGVKL